MSRYQYTEEDYNNIRQSLAYRNVITALNNVFGDAWTLDELFTDRPPDFKIRITLDNPPAVAYISAFDTHTSGMYAFGPGGFIGVSAPCQRGDFKAFDGTPIMGVDEMIGTPEEQENYKFGADGSNIERIEQYLHLLQRYLTTRKWRLFGCAKLRQVANSLRKTTP